MRIATAPINWNNEDVPEYRAWTPYPQVLDEIVKAGYRATEWSASLPTEPTELAAALEARDLALLGAFVGVNLRDPELRAQEIARAMQKARFLKELGARHLVAADAGDAERLAAAGHAEGATKLTSEELRGMAAALDGLGGAVGELGMELVFHPHVGTYVETPSEIHGLLASTDPTLVGWCLDTGHQVYGGAELVELVRAHKERIRYVHVKDVDRDVLARARREGWSFHQALERFVFSPLGTGLVPLPEVLRLLREAGYEGWLVVEQDTTDQDPTDTARRNREFLEALLRER